MANIQKGRIDLLVLELLNHGVGVVEKKYGLEGIKENIRPHLLKLVSDYIPSKIENPVIETMVNVWGRQVFK